jgi:putative Ca2+/H+ antiporter (TMEM165/GDT1 family)
LDAFLIPAGVIALAELGDKTQVLAFLLAARYRAPLPIIAGIAVAALANHGLAGGLGAWLATVVNPDVMRWCVGGAFLAVAAWMLLPEKADEADAIRPPRFGPFLTTLLAFFLAEMGDKTQVATMAMVVHFESFLPVIAGTTTGMLIANVPAVYIGDKMSHRLPARAINVTAALVFAVLGVLVLAGAGRAMAL